MSADWSERTHTLIRSALAEDLGGVGDVTSALLEDSGPVRARIVAREAGVIAGLSLAPLICRLFVEYSREALAPAAALRRAIEGGTAPSFSPAARDGGGATADGEPVTAGETVGWLDGPRVVLLGLERTLLNFLGRVSGVATLTRRYVSAARSVSPTVQVMDTRKTAPGWRELDRYAVRCGGGVNHRDGLYDAILVKDNHLAGVRPERLAATLFHMLNRAAESAIAPRFVEVEVDSPAQLDEVLKVVGVDVVLLDNFTVPRLAEAVRRRDALGLRGKVQLEASGGITLETVGAVAATGVERISIGALTHSAAWLDVALDLESR